MKCHQHLTVSIRVVRDQMRSRLSVESEAMMVSFARDDYSESMARRKPKSIQGIAILLAKVNLWSRVLFFDKKCHPRAPYAYAFPGDVIHAALFHGDSRWFFKITCRWFGLSTSTYFKLQAHSVSHLSGILFVIPTLSPISALRK